jgi:hypothetical protein
MKSDGQTNWQEFFAKFNLGRGRPAVTVIAICLAVI